MTFCKKCNFCYTIIYLGKINGVTKWFEDESFTQLHKHKSSQLINTISQMEKIQKAVLAKLQILSEEIEELQKFMDLK